jgi:hypothetical protein
MVPLSELFTKCQIFAMTRKTKTQFVLIVDLRSFGFSFLVSAVCAPTPRPTPGGCFVKLSPDHLDQLSYSSGHEASGGKGPERGISQFGRSIANVAEFIADASIREKKRFLIISLPAEQPQCGSTTSSQSSTLGWQRLWRPRGGVLSFFSALGGACLTAWALVATD